MDPCTVIGLLGAICNLIEASNHLVQVAKTLKEGDNDLLELCIDVTFLEEALKGFDRVLRNRQINHNISEAVIERALEESSRSIKGLSDKLTYIAKSEKSTVRRMRWLQHRATVKKLHERVKDQKATLRAFLELVHAYETPLKKLRGRIVDHVSSETFLNACSHYPELLQVRSAGERDSGLKGDTLAHLDTSETMSIASRASLGGFSLKSFETAPTSIDSAESSLPKVKSNISQASDMSTGPLIVREACRFDCYCSCHPKTELERGRMPTFSKSFSKLALSNSKCDDPNCQANTSSKGSEPLANFFRKTFLHISAAHSIKTRHHLKTFRTIPEGSDVIRYIKQGDFDHLKMAIETGKATIWDNTPDGWSLLHTAAYNRQLPAVKYLLQIGVDTEAGEIGSRKAADLAILNSLVSGATGVEHEINEAFAKKDDYLSEFSFTPVHITVLDLYDPNDRERPSLEMILTFVDDCNNAPINTDWAKKKVQYKKRSPLYGDVIEYFRSSAYERPKNTKIIQNLIDHKDRSLWWTPLHWACSKGKVESIRTLLYHGADPFLLSNLDANILHAAAESKNLGGLDDAIEVHKRHPTRLDINQRNRWLEAPLHVAAWSSAEGVRKLVAAGADLGARQENDQVPLHCTALSSDVSMRREMIDILCTRGDVGHINAQDADGRPPLFDFVDDFVCVEKLISYGAEIDLLDRTGKSVFHHACIQDKEETLECLLRLLSPGSVLVALKDHEGNTALIYALREKSRGCALILLQLNDVGDMVGEGGWTALHYGAKLGDVEVLESITKHKRFVKGMKTIDGKTAEQVAMEAGTWSGEVKTLLRTQNSIT